MPISRKRFSKKRTTKKSVGKNTRKHKKRTPRRKYKKSGKRLRFFGGDGEDGECAICTESLTVGKVFETNCDPIPHKFHLECIKRWCNDKSECTCPICRRLLDPNPNPNPVVSYPEPNPVVLYPNPNQFVENVNQWKFRIQFFKFVNNPETGETDRVPVRVQDISEEEIDILEKYFIDQILGLTPNSILFFREQDESNPNGYINLGENNDSVLINEGDMDINTIPPTIVQSVTITRIYGFNA
jgi:hypothetical protein